MGASVGGTLSDRLFEELELSTFMLPSCSQTAGIYSNGVNDWTSGESVQ